MESDEVKSGGFLTFAEEVVHISVDILSQAIADGDWMKVDKSYASNVDVSVERSILALSRETFPGWPIVTEEQHPKLPSGKSMISIDSLDGTSDYLAGRRDWSISVGIIFDGEPLGGIVVQPGLRRAYAALGGAGPMEYDYIDAQWCDFCRIPARRPTIGIDVGYNSPAGYWDEVRLLIDRTKFRPVNLPAVAGGIETLVGSTRGWWSHTAHHWDIAAIAAIIKEVGGVVECLDGSPVPWTQGTKLPPLLVAESPEWADRIRALIMPSETSHKRLVQK